MMKRKIRALALGCMLAVLAFPFVSHADVVDVYWDGKEACWDDSDEEYTERYQVVLYRGSTEVTRVKTTKTYYNFSSDMKKSGTYRFRVRAYEDGEYNAWSSYSEEKTVEGSSDSGTSSSEASTATDKNKTNQSTAIVYSPYREGWYLINGSWHYRYADGSEVKDMFALIDGAWYNFDSQGVMRTGWFKRGSTWFYLNQNGTMAVGWQQIGDRWYYFSLSDGTMLADTVSPDGYRLGTDGAWLP